MAMDAANHNYFGCLPLELLLQVFCQLDAISDAFALSKASRLSRRVWTTHRAAVLDAIQCKTVASYHDARRMASAMRYVLEHDEDARTSNEATSHAERLRMTGRMSIQFLINQNARNVELLCDYWTGIVSKDLSDSSRRFVPHRSPAYITDKERDRFAHACYRVWEFVVYSNLSNGKDAAERQAAVLDIGIAEHWLLCEICFFFMFDSTHFSWPRSDGLPCYDPDLYNPRELAKVSEAYRRKLQAAGHTGMIAIHEDCPMGLYMGLFDDHQSRLMQMAKDIYEGRRIDD